MEDGTAAKLKKLAEEMGYLHGSGCGSDNADAFQKLCRAKTIPLWNEAIAKVKPLNGLDHIRKNILRSRVRNGTIHTSSSELSGSMGRQVKLQHELQQMKKEKLRLMNEINSKETAIRDIQTNMKKKYCQTNFRENQINKAQHKRELLQMKKRDCESFISWLDDVNAAAKCLCPQKPFSSDKLRKSASSALEKCINEIEEYQMWCKESGKSETLDEEEHQAELNKRKDALWKRLTAHVGKVPSEQLWDSLLNFMEKSVQDMAVLASSVDLKEELKTLRDKAGDRMQPNQHLSAMHIKLMVDTAEYLVRGKILNQKVERLMEEMAEDAEVNLPNDFNTTTSSSHRQYVLEWLRWQCRRVALEAVKKALTDEAAAMKMRSRDLPSCAQRLKEEKAVVASLDEEIAEMKTSVEQGLAAINEVGKKLRNGQKGVIDELDAFAETSAFANDVMSSDSHDNTLSRCTFLNSTALPVERTFTCSTPAHALIPSYRQELFRLDETSSTNDSTQSIPKKNLKEIVSTLRNAASKESKSFFKLSLDLVPRIQVCSPSENMSDLLVESPELIARLALSRAGSVPKQLMQLPQFPITRSTNDVLLHVFQKLAHVRAMRIQQLLSEPSAPPTLYAGMAEHFLKVAATDQESIIRKRLKDIVTLIENTEGGLLESQECFNNWVSRPVQKMVADHLQVEGRTLKEWKKKYDLYVGQLK